MRQLALARELPALLKKPRYETSCAEKPEKKQPILCLEMTANL
jgi:hypothetical protein